jgi:thiamine kinase-like enzyme
MSVISEVLRVSPEKITDIHVLKKGMTNRSFLFTAKEQRYIMRIPGEGTDRLINRREEAAVYRAISGKGFCDDPVYLNPENGYKLTRYLEHVRVCDPLSPPDLKAAMEKLVSFHQQKLQVSHTFDLFHQIELYEQFWEGKPSIYRDYAKTKARIMELGKWIGTLDKDWCLTHIDAVPDNFLFYPEDGKEKVQLTDWEYAGMQDPHLDIAMFSIYSFYDKARTDQLIDLYFSAAGMECSPLVRAKIYAYMAAGGLLWSNWCEFKSIQGIEFGEYSLRQYRYAKEFYDYALEERNR